MVKIGLPNERPWSGGGNATYWGGSMPRITDDTPRVGAVAWWKANTGPAGSSGHVAYVERVVSADEIVISQDSWGGDFSWAVVPRGPGTWQRGFEIGRAAWRERRWKDGLVWGVAATI